MANRSLKGLLSRLAKGKCMLSWGPMALANRLWQKFLAGHPSYEVTEGEVWFKGQNLLEMEPEERAAAGLFMSFQYPIEIPGVSNRLFLKTALNAQKKINISDGEFETLLAEKMALMEIRSEFKDRAVNEGFSGGEKKRNEILQMALFNPDLAILDETDSGLDIDAMRIVAAGVNKLRRSDAGLYS